MDLYSEIILDHYKHPHNKSRIKNATHSAEELNESCGDKIIIDLLVDKSGKISKASFEGTGCAISQAAASMLTNYLVGKDIKKLSKMKNEEMLKMLNIPIGPGRIKCALLALTTAKKAIIYTPTKHKK
jgi:nitrogen fixation protein NifU and related proteins